MSHETEVTSLNLPSLNVELKFHMYIFFFTIEDLCLLSTSRVAQSAGGPTSHETEVTSSNLSSLPPPPS